jgi:hypothetical protein
MFSGYHTTIPVFCEAKVGNPRSKSRQSAKQKLEIREAKYNNRIAVYLPL